MISNRGFLFLSVAVLLPCLGCGDGRPTRVPVSGQVLIDGRPLTHGFIQVIPKGDRAARGDIGPDGRFELTTFEHGDGCVLGTHTVTITATETLGPTAQQWHAPKDYMDPAKSGLTLEVTQQTDSAVIKLSWNGGKPFIERAGAE